jgi:hypothetical protein
MYLCSSEYGEVDFMSGRTLELDSGRGMIVAGFQLERPPFRSAR